MKRRDFISTSALGVTATATGLAATPKAGPMPGPDSATSASVPAPPSVPPLPPALGPSGGFLIGWRAQLFIDRQVVHATSDIAFTAHAARKHPSNPLIRADRPEEGWRIHIYGAVLFDQEEKVFKMWYHGATNESFPRQATYYATSGDGIHWEKPRVGTVRAKGLAQHNAVVEGCQIASVFKEPAEPDPARRYKMIEWTQRAKTARGAHAHISPDGLNWTRVSDGPLFPSGDVVTAFYDPERKLYVGLPKLYAPVGAGLRRCFAVAATTDFMKWPEPRLVLSPDRRDDAGTLTRLETARGMLDVPINPQVMRTEFYGVGTYVAESCVVGFPWVFSINNSARFPTNQERKGQDGVCEIQLAATRDLLNWDRPFRTPVIPLGQQGEWDSGFLSTASQAFRHNDEIWLYYSGSNYSHGVPVIYPEYKGTERGTRYTGSIGLAKWRLDRFVSADGGVEGGVLTTTPVHVEGRRLEINVDASKGAAVVEVLNAAGKPIAGFGKSDPVRADSLRATVTWQGKPDLSVLLNQAVSFRFSLRSARLFSFALRA